MSVSAKYDLAHHALYVASVPDEPARSRRLRLMMFDFGSKIWSEGYQLLREYEKHHGLSL